MREAEYHRMAGAEDRLWYYHLLHRRIIDALPAERPALRPRLLDAGCGTGGLLRRLASARCDLDLVGVDNEPLACQLAAERAPAAVIQRASVVDLPFADASFDALVCADVLYHLEDDAAALRELARVSRPGAVLVVNVPALPWLWSYHDVAVGGVRRYTAERLARILDEAGLRVLRLVPWNGFCLPFLIARRKCWPPPRPLRSDVAPLPRPLEAFFRALGRVELALARRGWSPPAGGSLLAVATRP